LKESFTPSNKLVVVLHFESVAQLYGRILLCLAEFISATSDLDSEKTLFHKINLSSPDANLPLF